MTAALIGITSYPRVVDIVPTPTVLQTANRFFVESVVRAGGVPVILPVVAPELAAAAVGRVDGLVVPGGGDVDPARYGEEPSPETNTVDGDRDAWEVACIEAAMARRLPVLAVCRGMQVLNVALGGTLVQHLPAVTECRHAWADRYAEGVHRVRLAPGSRVAAVVGGTELDTNSLHHQAVARLGEGVTAVGWAADGTVEAVEVERHPEVLAVQWHPELMEHDEAQQRLFVDLVSRAG
jgi:putative glutamine amidotransferase